MTTETYKTTATGSIDYAHYLKKSHQLRSAEAHAAVGRVWSWLKGIAGFRGAQQGVAGTTESATPHHPVARPMARPLPRLASAWRRRERAVRRSDAA